LFTARIRGIYTTALTRLLIDHGFKIVQPSTIIKERFKFEGGLWEEGIPDLRIHDRRDRQGINAVGSIEAIKFLAETLKSTLDDVVIRGGVISLFSSHDETRITTNSESEGSSMLKSGIFLTAEFPALSKKKLDDLRSSVTPTLKGHHYYRACGGRIASLLGMAERLLEKGCPLDEVEDLFKETIRSEYPHSGLMIDIEHVKIDGRCFHLGNPKIIEFNEEESKLKLYRRFMRRGIYDGLKTLKEPGDYAITDLKIGDLSLKTRYFSSNGDYKGTYININTPIELYPRKIRYVDLEVDICIWPDGKISTIDMDKLQKRISMGYISERIEEITKERIEKILNSIDIDLEREPA